MILQLSILKNEMNSVFYLRLKPMQFQRLLTKNRNQLSLTTHSLMKPNKKVLIGALTYYSVRKIRHVP